MALSTPSLASQPKVPAPSALPGRVLRPYRQTKAAAGGSAVLDRPSSERRPARDYADVYADDKVDEEVVFELPQLMPRDAVQHFPFRDYQDATEDLGALESLTKQLQLQLEETSNLVESAWASPSLSPTPAPTEEDEAARQRRREKRAASRASRTKAQPTSAAASTAVPASSSNSSRISSSLGASTSAAAAPRAAPTASARAQSARMQSASAAPSAAEASTSLSPTIARKPASSPAPRPSTASLSILPAAPSAASSTARSTRGSKSRSLQQTSILPVGATGAGLLPSTSGEEVEQAPTAKARHARRAATYTKATAADAPAATLADITPKLGDRNISRFDGTTQILKKGASWGLLDTEAEGKLTILVKDFLFLERLAKQLKQALKRDPTMSEWAMAVKMDVTSFESRMLSGQRAKQLMLQANHRLVVSICKKYAGRGIPMQDLITEGIHGLLRGIEKFDHSKGFKLSTYVHWWIRQGITRSLSEQSRTIRLPAHLYDVFTKIQAARQSLMKQNGDEPGLDEVAEACGLSVTKVQEVLTLARQPASLDVPMGGDDDETSTAMDLLEDDHGSAVDHVMSYDEDVLAREIEGVLSELTEREAGVMRLRFGLNGGQEMTLEDIGAAYNVTRERIRQIEAKALRKLRSRSGKLSAILAEYMQGRLGEGHESLGRVSCGTRKT